MTALEEENKDLTFLLFFLKLEACVETIPHRYSPIWVCCNLEGYGGTCPPTHPELDGPYEIGRAHV